MNVLGADRVIPPGLPITNNSNSERNQSTSSSSSSSSMQQQQQQQQQQHLSRKQRQYYDYPTEFCQLPTDTTDGTTAATTTTMTHTLLQSVHQFVHMTKNSHGQYHSPHPYLDVIIVTAGGFEMNPPSSSSFNNNNHNHNNSKKRNPPSSPPQPEIDSKILQNATAYIQTMERMYEQNFNPVVAASIVAQHYMNPHLHPNHYHQNYDHDNDAHDRTRMKMKGTLFVAIGAMAALQPTPTMMGYGSAKNAIHHYIQSFGACTGGGISTAAAGTIYTNLKDSNVPYNNNNNDDDDDDQYHSSGGSDGSRPLIDSKLVRQAGRSVRKDLPSLDYLTVIGLLPTMLDTPSNRHSIRIQQQQQQQKLGKKKNKKTMMNGDHHGDNMDDNHQAGTVNNNDDDDDDDRYDFSSTLIAPLDLVHEIGTWITTPALRPHSGALIKVVPPQQQQQGGGGARFELVR
jgi:hypothetical protein